MRQKKTTVWLPEALAEQAGVAARVRGTSVNAVIVEALSAEIERVREHEDFYPDLPDRAAVLTCRLAWNHPLPAGNKRATWASLVVFMDPNGGHWDPDPPDTDEAEEAMLAVAASEVDEVWFAQWLAARVRFDG